MDAVETPEATGAYDERAMSKTTATVATTTETTTTTVDSSACNGDLCDKPAETDRTWPTTAVTSLRTDLDVVYDPTATATDDVTGTDVTTGVSALGPHWGPAVFLLDHPGNCSYNTPVPVYQQYIQIDKDVV